MGVEGSTTEVVIIILCIVLIFAIISACCRGLGRGYRRHIAAERRQREFYLDPTSRLNSNAAQRALRVTTISREGDTIAMGVYEINMPRNHSGVPNRSNRIQRPRVLEVSPPPPFHSAYQVSSPVGGLALEEPPPSYDDYMKINGEFKDDKSSTKESLPERY